MKRTLFATLIFGIALLVAPAAQAHVMSDDGSGGGGVALMTDTLGGNGASQASAVPLRPDILGGDGESASIPIRPDVLGGNGHSTSVEWLTNQLGRDAQKAEPPAISSDDSFAWGDVLGASLIAAMLLALATIAVTRRRHRLSF